MKRESRQLTLRQSDLLHVTLLEVKNTFLNLRQITSSRLRASTLEIQETHKTHLEVCRGTDYRNRPCSSSLRFLSRLSLLSRLGLSRLKRHRHDPPDRCYSLAAPHYLAVTLHIPALYYCSTCRMAPMVFVRSRRAHKRASLMLQSFMQCFLPHMPSCHSSVKS
jgi:hypothetical protein